MPGLPLGPPALGRDARERLHGGQGPRACKPTPIADEPLCPPRGLVVCYED